MYTVIDNVDTDGSQKCSNVLTNDVDGYVAPLQTSKQSKAYRNGWIDVPT